jgi:hypothetical protein
MRKAEWTPSIVPNGDDQTVYIVVDDFGRHGRAYRETDVERAHLEAVITDLLEGQYQNPVRVVGFNTAEKWSQDVSGDVAHELRHRCDLQLRDVPFYLEDFVERCEGRYHDIQLPLPMRLVARGVSAQKASGNRHQGALSGLYRAGVGHIDREGAGRTLDP